MTYTYDPLSGPVFQVRRTIPDRPPPANSDADFEDTAIFSDEEIASFVADEEGSWRRAAALALETIASNEVYTLKVVKTFSVTTDGAKTAEALLARAALLREQALLFDLPPDGSSGLFDVAEQVNGPFSLRERIYNDALRQGY